jgi:hypothetical protein
MMKSQSLFYIQHQQYRAYELDEPKLRIPKRKRRCNWQEYQVQSEGKYGSQDCLMIASFRYAKFSLAKEQY